MNYKKIYVSLINRGKSRSLECYKESHHILPKCLGGTDDESNLVDLTPEEHYVAHQLLTKIYPDNIKLARAVAMMVSNRPTNKMYGWVRRRFANAQSVAYTGEGNSQYGTKWIHNLLTGKAMKTSGEIPDGWELGRIKKIIPVSKRKIIKQEHVKLYTEYYEIYNNYGFDKFVEITGYSKSKPNLVQMFSRHVEGFIPQNGKKR
jgi:hypothetical protein